MILRSVNINRALRQRQRGFLLNPYRFGGGGGGTDPDFASVATLLHFESSLTDNAPTPKSYSLGGGAFVDTAQFKWGAQSLRTDGSGDFISTNHHANFDTPSGDFTAECWFRVNGGLGGQMILIAKATNAGESPYYLFVTTGSKIGWNGFDQSAGLAYGITGTTTLTTGVWYHAAGVRDGNTFRVYLDGVQEGTASYSGLLKSSGSDQFVAGGFNNGGQSFNGWIDDLRFTKGVCRYPSGTTFSVPTAAFPDS